MNRAFEKAVVRLLLTSLLLGVVAGSSVCFLLFLASTRDCTSTPGGIRSAVGCLTVPGASVFLVSVAAALVSLPMTQRLTRTFGLSDRWPYEAAKARRLALAVAKDRFFDELSAAVQRYLPVIHEQRRCHAWTIRLGGLYDYSLVVEQGSGNEPLVLVVRNRGPLSRLQPNDLPAARVLAGLLVELARKGVIQDCAELPVPVSLQRDLGAMWGGGAVAVAPVARRARFTKAAFLRMAAVVVAAVGVFLGTASLEQSGQISKLVRLVPALLALIYVNAEIAFAMRSDDARACSDKPPGS